MNIDKDEYTKQKAQERLQKTLRAVSDAPHAAEGYPEKEHRVPRFKAESTAKAATPARETRGPEI